MKNANEDQTMNAYSDRATMKEVFMKGFGLRIFSKLTLKQKYLIHQDLDLLAFKMRPICFILKLQQGSWDYPKSMKI